MPEPEVVAYVRAALPPPPARVLEIGAGDGTLAAVRREAGGRRVRRLGARRARRDLVDRALRRGLDAAGHDRRPARARAPGGGDTRGADRVVRCRRARARRLPVSLEARPGAALG